MEGENGTQILHRRPNFFVFTTSHSDHQPQSLFPRPTGRVSVLGKVALHPMLQITSRLRKLEQRKAKEKTHSQELSVSTAQPIEATTRDLQQASLVKTSVFSLPTWLEVVLVIVGLVVSFAAHAYNMFNFPRYELDEGTYMSSAWAILNGLITPYPYGYGHPPLGWMQIAVWVQLTGGFFTFGNALNSGRVLMLLYAIGGSLLVYLIVRRMAGSCSSGLLAMILFSLSPLSLVYQRQVFLDNISTFWLLLALYLIVASNSRLSYIVFGAFSFGVSILSKEVFLLFTPVVIYAAWLYTTKYQRKFVLVTFTYTIVALGSCFLLMAILKDELFPYSWHLPWDHHPHLSLLDTLVQQVQRGQSEGEFSDSWYAWTHGDFLLMVLSIAAPIYNLIAGWWNRKQLLLSLFAISYWILLIRGGVVLSFYIIPMIPLVAINAIIAFTSIATWLGKLVRFGLVPALLIFAIIGVIVPYDLQHAEIAFTQHPTSAQTDAMVWVRNNVPHNDVIVINSYLYMDLRQPDSEGVGDGATFPNAHIYWNIAYDPELYTGLLQGNWDRIDYIVADSEMLHDIQTTGGPMLLIEDALQHSILRVEFRANENDSQIAIYIYQVMHAQALPTV